MRKVLKKYRAWKNKSEEEIGLRATVKMVCDECGYKWVDGVVLTLPPCPKCGGEETFEFETVSV